MIRGRTIFPVLMVFPIIMILYSSILFGWFYTLGTNLYTKLPESVSMNLKIFKLFMAIPFCYILFISVAIAYGGFYLANIGIEGPPNPALMLFIPVFIGIHLFSIFCILYTMWFIAKALKSIEYQRSVVFADFAGDIFLICFFPIGIWIIQPKINKLFSELA